MDPLGRTGHTRGLLDALLFISFQEQRRDLRLDFGVQLYCFTVPAPLPISGQIQCAFRVNGELRGVAAIGKTPLEALTARCLIGMECLATRLNFQGPVFGVAFTRNAWNVVDMPVHYAHDEIQRDHRNYRFHISYDSREVDDTELFLGAVHTAITRAAAFSSET